MPIVLVMIIVIVVVIAINPSSIIVNPNNARVKNAGIIGNTGNLLSVLSFILTSIVLITSN